MSDNGSTGRTGERLDRRQFLLGGTSAATVALSGCSGDDEEDDEAEPADSTGGNGSSDGQSDDGSESNGQSAENGETDDLLVTFEHPDRVAVDEPFGMTIGGLPPNERVDVRWGKSDRVATTTATVETDAEGTVDLTDATVVDGDVPADLDVPLSVALIQFTEDQTFGFRKSGADSLAYGVDVDGEEVGRTELTRVYPPGTPAIDLQEAHETLVGPVFEPVGRERGPGVIVLHGSGGSPSTGVAAQLALNGYTALALHYFDGPGLPQDLVEVPLEYVGTAIDWLLDYETTTGEQAGLLGYSKGGELSLLAGSQYEDVGAVVSIAGSGVVWAGFDGRGLPETSSWSLDGDPVPYVPYARVGWNESVLQGYQNSFDEATDEELEAATIPVEEIDGRVLLVTGGDDQLWDTERFHGVAADRLTGADGSDFEHLVYDGAGHGIAPPYYPIRRTLDSPYGPLGGTLEANAEASHGHWPHDLESLGTLGPDEG